MTRAVDAIRQRHAEHRAASEGYKTRILGTSAKLQEEEERHERIRDLANAPSGMPSLFGWSDFILLCIILVVAWYVIRSNMGVDIAVLAWRYVQPQYDEGLFDTDDAAL